MNAGRNEIRTAKRQIAGIGGAEMFKIFRVTVLVTVMTTASAYAQEAATENLPEIEVTATKLGATNVQQTALAVSAFSADQLATSLTTSVQGLAQFVPNLNVSQVTANPVITIRGIGTNNVFNGSDPDVTMQLDGIYVARPAGQTSDFLDVSNVEVLRGPQGTLYGRNAVGGTINIISQAPTDKFSAQEVLNVGNFNLVQDQAYVSGALIPGKLQASVAVNYLRHDDYQKNIVPGAQSGVNSGNHGGGRIQLRYEPTDYIDATTRADWTALREDLSLTYNLLVPYPASPLVNSILGNYTKVALNSPSTNATSTGGVSEEINITFNDMLRLKSLSGYRITRFSIYSDNDGTPLNSIVGHQAENEHQLSQEFNLIGKYGPLESVAGLYFFTEDDATNVYALILGPHQERHSTPATNTKSGAGFVQGIYHITPEVSFTAGLRYTEEQKYMLDNFQSFNFATGVPNPGFPAIFPDTRKFSAVTPKFALDWQIEPNVLAYLSATRGYKSGGMNYAATSIATASFSPESLWSYEGGIKSEWLDRKLRLNLTAFHYDYSNLQIQGTLSPGVILIANAASAKVDGLETELSAKITSAFRIDANVSLLDARYTSFPAAAVPSALQAYEVGNPRYTAAAGTYNASENYLNQSPRVSGSLAGQYDWGLTSGASIYARGEYYYQARVYYDPSNSPLQSQGAYATVNTSVGYISTDGHWRTQFWAKNLTDKHYLIATLANGVEPAGIVAPPRTFGVRVSKTW
jgi:iron complex outermembrane recepter protein